MPQPNSEDTNAQGLVRSPRSRPVLPPTAYWTPEPCEVAEPVTTRRQLQAVKRHGLMIAILATAGVAAGFAVSFFQTPMFLARTSLELQRLDASPLGLRGVGSEGGTPTESDIPTQVKLLQSRSLIRAAASRVQAAARPAGGRVPGIVAGCRRLMGFPERPPVSEKQALTEATETLKLTADGRTRIIELKCESPDPRIAAEFANALTNVYIDNVMASRWNTTQRTGEWLSEQLADLKQTLEKSSRGLEDYARTSGLLFTSPTETAAEESQKTSRSGHLGAD
jgi:polysaccharide biosynthesis transport protein